jgi:hypothetical protein
MRACDRLTGKHDCFDDSLKFIASVTTPTSR